MNPLALATALLLLGSALGASAEAWDPADVAEAKRLQSEETARAAEYRRRVARGDIRAESAPMPREAPQRPDDDGEVETLGDFFDRLFRRAEGPRSERGRSREELRREQREKRRVEREPARDAREADDWWEEEERRMRGAR